MEDRDQELDVRSRARHPDCAFNPFACPLPPPENQLRAGIAAGELDYVKSGKAY
jgi:uncharacterized protein (DUF1684 family)